MPRVAKVLGALEVRRLSRPGFHQVGGVAGLMLQITPTGEGRSWVLRTVVAGSRRAMGLGPYPEVTLAQARAKAAEMKEQIRQGRDPIAERRAARRALVAAKSMTFADAARAKHEAIRAEFSNPKHASQWWASVETYALPVLGQLDVADIEPAHVVQALQPIWTSKTETATRVRQRIAIVLDWAKVAGYRAGDNPAAWRGNLDQLLPAPTKISKVEHHAALPWREVPEFMQALRMRKGMSARALEFAILTAARSGEARGATWAEIDLGAGLWTVPAERMKGRKEHVVPLSGDALALLRALPRFAGSDLLFTAPRGGKLSDMSLSAVCRRMQVPAVPHGFRSSFKDWARSNTAYPDEVSELALAHVSSDATRAAYARADLLPLRARLLEDWAKFCREGLSAGAEVVQIGRARA